MKKIVILSLIVSVLFLSGCKTSTTQNNQDTSKNYINDNEIFNKKKECAAQYNEMVAYIEDQHNWDEKEGGAKMAFIEEVFYSKKLNTCIILVKYNTSYSTMISSGKFAIDFFTKKQVRFKEDSCREKNNDTGKWQNCENTENNMLLEKELQEIRE